MECSRIHHPAGAGRGLIHGARSEMFPGCLPRFCSAHSTEKELKKERELNKPRCLSQKENSGPWLAQFVPL
jgi:hypothetical protein